jgi:hypothetical protein
LAGTINVHHAALFGQILPFLCGPNLEQFRSHDLGCSRNKAKQTAVFRPIHKLPVHHGISVVPPPYLQHPSVADKSLLYLDDARLDAQPCWRNDFVRQAAASQARG